EVVPAIAALLELLATKAKLQLRAIDVDAGGAELSGAHVEMTRVVWPDGTFESSANGGVTPAELLIEPGEYRVTVVDASGDRTSEQRLTARPGEEITRLAFIRSTATVTASMAFVPAAEFPYGPPSVSTSVVHVDEFWIDPSETTKAQWAEFWNAF